MTTYIHRDMEKTILRLSQSYAALLISGPRQVGKTTMLRNIMGPQRHYVTLDNLTDRELARNDPPTFLELYKPPVLIDEVQYAPELFSYIKIAIDNGAKPGSFWLTGSQVFQTMHLAQESLAGRVGLLNLPPLSQHELYGKGDLTEFSLALPVLQSMAENSTPVSISSLFERIWRGGLPGYTSGKFPDRDVFFNSYITTYLERDVADLLVGVDKLLFASFLRAAACRAGQQLSVHSIANDVDISDKTAKQWLSILERSHIIFYLYPYSNNVLKRLVKTPKMYFFDTGLVAYLTRYSTPEILENGAMNGALFENYVVSEIRKRFLNLGRTSLLWYYRDFDQDEIDLIIEADGKLFPLEIKKTAMPKLSMLHSFSKLEKAQIPVGTGAILCSASTLGALDAQHLIIPISML